MNEPFTVVGLGEVLWDVFPDGPRFGGAPANFACHAAMLGAGAFMVSRVGKDELGDRAIAALRGHGVNADHVAAGPDFPTGFVRVELDAAGKPIFEITEGVAWDHIPWSDQLGNLAARADAVCFGTLCQRGETSRRTIRRFVEATRPECLRIFDVNLRQHHYNATVVLESLGLAGAVKLNDEELPVVSAICGLEGTEREILEALRDRFNLRLAALTRGPKGAKLLTRSANADCLGFPVEVKDTVGAGDAFTAAMAMGWLRGRNLDTIVRHACGVASFVCSQPGATPAIPAELRS
jgi:fructokinase